MRSKITFFLDLPDFFNPCTDPGRAFFRTIVPNLFKTDVGSFRTKIDAIKQGEENLGKELSEERASVDALLESSQKNAELLKKIAESNDVNEEYIYTVIDKWAASRKVKIKK